MSETDSFIEEVSEEVRRDRMFKLWKRFGPYVIGAVVAIVVLAGVNEWMNSQAKTQAENTGAALTAASAGTPAEAAQALTVLADAAAHDGEAVMARLMAAAAFAEAGDDKAAAEAYDLVNLDPNADLILRDFAAFRALMLRSADMAPADLVNALNPVAEGQNAFRILALEARGVAQFRAGNADAAAADLKAVVEDQATPNSARSRASALLTAMGVSLEESDPEAVAE
ncbi:MAG: tetratricopeptide repeat protein [Pikeienuella sp.]